MSKIIGSELKNIPWEEKPEGYSLPVWRFSGNPIIGRHATKRSNSVFNSAVVLSLKTIMLCQRNWLIRTQISLKR